MGKCLQPEGPFVMPRKIISGGQTGADRAALDAALSGGFPVGGFCPAGRQAEDGEIPKRYPLTEIEGGVASAWCRKRSVFLGLGGDRVQAGGDSLNRRR